MQIVPEESAISSESVEQTDLPATTTALGSSEKVGRFFYQRLIIAGSLIGCAAVVGFAEASNSTDAGRLESFDWPLNGLYKL